jgi:hypothetical protein
VAGAFSEPARLTTSFLGPVRHERQILDIFLPCEPPSTSAFRRPERYRDHDVGRDAGDKENNTPSSSFHDTIAAGGSLGDPIVGRLLGMEWTNQNSKANDTGSDQLHHYSHGIQAAILEGRGSRGDG